MQYAVTLLALGAAAVNAAVAPSSPPPGCKTTVSGAFTVVPKNITGPGSSKEKRQQLSSCGSDPNIALTNGVLTNGLFRDGVPFIGSVLADNHQFQFDPVPGQPNAITSPFSVCSNGTLAIGNNAVFYACDSGGFGNVYGQSIGAQCYPVYLETYPCLATGSIITTVGPSATAGPASASSGSASASSASSVSSVASSSPVISSAATTSSASYPVTNGTTSAPTGTAPAGSTSTSSPTSSPSPKPFTGAADMLAVGQSIVVGVAALAAYAML